MIVYAVWMALIINSVKKGVKSTLSTLQKGKKKDPRQTPIFTGDERLPLGFTIPEKFLDLGKFPWFFRLNRLTRVNFRIQFVYSVGGNRANQDR